MIFVQRIASEKTMLSRVFVDQLNAAMPPDLQIVKFVLKVCGIVSIIFPEPPKKAHWSRGQAAKPWICVLQTAWLPKWNTARMQHNKGDLH